MPRSVKQAIIVLAAAVIASLLYFYFDPSSSHFFPPCPFYALTGFACPGCGSQRAFHDLLHGRFLGAIDHNLLFVLFTPLIVYSAFVAMNNAFREEKMRQAVFYSPLFAKSILVMVLVFWGMRNIPVFPFNWLAP